MTKKTIKLLTLLAVLVMAGALLAGCAQTPEATEAPAPAPTQACPEQQPCPELPEQVPAPFEEAWKNSPHADASAEAFRHWDEEDPAEVPANCATCHSSAGFLDFVGADGSEMFVTDANAPIDTVITCETCHNDATASLDTVNFPSGAVLTGLGREAVCMTCHQGRASKVQVDEAITTAGVEDDVVSEDLRFINIHYYAAAVSRFGTEVMGGYEYEGMSYDTLFEHVPGVTACQDCHNPHSLELQIETCANCHEAETAEDLRDVREPSSFVDYDGDGDVEEGVYYEIEGLRTMLYDAMVAYSTEVAGTPIFFDAGSYPYYFADANGNAAIDEGEGSYASWTPRLLKAAYNFQTATKDTGGYAHGGKYIIQLLHDSIASLNEQLSSPIDLSMAARDDAGHFASSTEAWRHWDEDGAVPASCAKCHSAEGLPLFIKEGVNISTDPTSGLWCESCHNTAEWPAVYQVETVEFPSGAELGFADNLNANLCLNCHQGRASGATVARAVNGLGDDEASDSLRFTNVHYFAAGATLFGADAAGVYEYEGKEYAGQFVHTNGFSTCVDCHDVHGLEVKAATCTGCHQVDDPHMIRLNLTADYDGDGDTAEGVAGEIETMTEMVYNQMVEVTIAAGNPILYDAHAYPYFFADANGNGAVDEGEGSYSGWTPRVLKAAYNYQYVQKDPGAFAHNGRYILQVLFDTLEDLGADVTGMVRP